MFINIWHNNNYVNREYSLSEKAEVTGKIFSQQF